VSCEQWADTQVKLPPAASSGRVQKGAQSEFQNDIIQEIGATLRPPIPPNLDFEAVEGEAGCKVVIGARLKRAGMPWIASGANAIIALRCSKLSRRYEDFSERCTERAAA